MLVVDDIKSDVVYVKEKEKQAQIVGPLTRRTNDRINLKLKLQLLSFNVTRYMYSVELYSEKSTFPLSKIVQPVIMLDRSPSFTSISFKSFKLILSFVLLSGPN
jgi:hypothetical protein